MTRTRTSLVALVVTSAFALGACGGGADARPTLGERRVSGGPTTTTLAPYTSRIAAPIAAEVTVHTQPDASSPAEEYPNPWQLDDDPDHVVPQVFLVVDQQGPWVEVLLPVRPNGTTGWVRARDVRLTQNYFRITVELAAHRITVYDGDTIMLQEPIAVGKAATPTPVGTYYLRVLLRAPDPNTVYGPFAYGLSGHSDVLTSFNGGDAELGIHGNNDASVLGTDASAGCIRMTNDGITRLAGILPLGTPVEITP